MGDFERLSASTAGIANRGAIRLAAPRRKASFLVSGEVPFRRFQAVEAVLSDLIKQILLSLADRPLQEQWRSFLPWPWLSL